MPRLRIPNLFVYGTLLDFPVAKIPGVVHGYRLYSAKAFPVAMHVPGGVVTGQMLMRVDERTIQDFDHIEGFNIHEPETSLYWRKEVTVNTLMGEHQAWMYYSVPERFTSLQLIPHGSWERWENGER